MSEMTNLCDLCSKEIPLGAAYVSLNYYIEQEEQNLITLQSEIQVISAEAILTLCGSCGNKHHGQKMKEILKTTLRTQSPSFN